jgi:hypothetical protein
MKAFWAHCGALFVGAALAAVANKLRAITVEAIRVFMGEISKLG